MQIHTCVKNAHVHVHVYIHVHTHVYNSYVHVYVCMHVCICIRCIDIICIVYEYICDTYHGIYGHNVYVYMCKSIGDI